MWKRVSLGLVALALVACGSGATAPSEGWDDDPGAGENKGNGTSTGDPTAAGDDAGTPSDDADPSGDGGVIVTGGDAGAAATPTSVKFDGQAMTVTKMTVWPKNSAGTASVFIQFSGTGVTTGTDVHVELSKIGSGCNNSPAPMPQDLWYRPPLSSGDSQYLTADGASCGLTVTAIPAKAGDLAAGSFTGKVYGINSTAKTHTLAITFSTATAPQAP